MKKIGIITFHRACNYGAVLQVFSLCNAINSFDDTSAYVIDYHCSNIEDNYKISGIFLSGSGLKTILLKLLRIKDIIKRNRIFKTFIMNNLRLVSFDDLKLQDYHRFVTGSDQVWNLKLTGNDKNYFLDFVQNNKQKVSYSASAGKVIDSDINELVNLVSDFHAVSVRENTLYEAMVSENFPNLYKTLDPVFLTSKKKWLKVAGRKKCVRSDYILVFIMGVTKQGDYIVNLAKKIAEEKNCKVILAGDQERWYKYRDIQHFGVASPQEFLNLIANAEQVITNSFHATAFSILFNTDFLVECNINSPERIDSLLELTGLSSHRVYDGKLLSDSPIKIDWKAVEKNLKLEIYKSRKFIEEFIVK